MLWRVRPQPQRNAVSIEPGTDLDEALVEPGVVGAEVVRRPGLDARIQVRQHRRVLHHVVGDVVDRACLGWYFVARVDEGRPHLAALDISPAFVVHLTLCRQRRDHHVHARDLADTVDCRVEAGGFHVKAADDGHVAFSFA